MIEHNNINPITEDDIANFLLHTPDFFVRHAEILSQIRISNPHGQRAVSLQERQADMLREKIRAHETRLMEMIRNGNENLILTDRLHRWAKNLLLVNGTEELTQTLVREIQHQFMVPQVALKLWGLHDEHASNPSALGVTESAKEFANSLLQPYCGPNSGFEAIAWLEDAKAVQSIAMVSLRTLHLPGDEDEKQLQEKGVSLAESLTLRGAEHDELMPCMGLLVLASPDPQRYHAGMGTDFLTRIGELCSAVLMRLLV
jgi:uncharacterized protein YigA (DUF484 family)